MDEQMKYEVIKSLADHPTPNKQRAALTLGQQTIHLLKHLQPVKHRLFSDPFKIHSR